ncbi:venom protein 302-like [Amphibalanus amphitrite]|uniref:venom protein 302-like n=1 Tax=Amphibalanus amphitrite TaxID=1232801 RepID=UPI001C900E0B|nr:venom protein 302-like [Amphibalanus amphitrite]
MLRLLTIACLLAAAAALSCPPPPCKPEECGELPNCKAGVGIDFCQCCPVCLRAEGEPCGGQYEGSPKCGEGLMCFKPPLREGQIAYNQDGFCRRRRIGRH